MHSRFLIASSVAIALLVQGCSHDGRADSGPEGTHPATQVAAPDSSTHPELRVSDNGRVLTATDKNGRVLWSIDVIEKAGPPAVGAPIIRHVSVVNGEVSVVYGKHSFASFDPTTGKLLSSGSD